MKIQYPLARTYELTQKLIYLHKLFLKSSKTDTYMEHNSKFKNII